MTHYRPYIIAYAVFLACLFASPYAYSFFDFHIANAFEHYEMDRHAYEAQNGGEIAYMNFSEWQEATDAHSKDFYNEFADQCALSFDPWFEPGHHNLGD